jgi:5-methylthioadenosine/S-adenosylhomocysteine deaminase
MRTLVQGGWVVGFDGQRHELLRDGQVVYEDGRILFVGHGFGGQVDRQIDARGKLVSPGLINCHMHTDSNAREVVLNDPTVTNYFGSNWLAYGSPRRGKQPPQPRAEVEGKMGLWASVRGGATTVLDIGARPWMVDEIAEVAGELGVRAYLGPFYRSANYALDEQGRIQWDWDEQAGMAGLEQAGAFIRRYHGSFDDRIRGMLYPGQLDSCTPELLQATKRAASELGVGVQLHAAMNLLEFHQVLRERQRTPIQYLHDIGFLGPEVGLGHGLFHAGHSWAHYPYADDLKLLADSGTYVAHAPYKYAKMGLSLESFDSYRKRGITVALGTDTFPQDLVHEMRVAALACRQVEGSFLAGQPRDVYDAATLGGAKALGRDDLGRVAPGARADLIVVNLRQMHYGGVRDPIKSLVESGSAADVETVVINGETLLDQGRAVRVDEAKLLEQTQEAAEEFWASVPNWRARGETIDNLAPMSYAVRASAPQAG